MAFVGTPTFDNTSKSRTLIIEGLSLIASANGNLGNSADGGAEFQIPAVINNKTTPQIDWETTRVRAEQIGTGSGSLQISSYIDQPTNRITVVNRDSSASEPIEIRVDYGYSASN